MISAIHNTGQQPGGASKRLLLLVLPILLHDDHDDDDDDHDGDHGGGTGGGEIPVDSSEIIQLVPALNGVQAYKVYKPTAYVSPTSSDICNSQGANGVFLTSLNGSNNNNVGVKAFAIDTYSSRSGGTLPPIPKPNPLDTSCSIFN